jgi:DNA transposition AAA+ family ATPase
MSKTASIGTTPQFVQEYLNRSGMSAVDFARRIGYAHPTLRMFLDGKYLHHAGADDSRIAAAALDFIARFPLEIDSIASKNMYETGAVRVMRAAFARLLEEPQMFLLYAPPGSGKTDIARHQIAEHNAQRRHGHASYIFRIYCRTLITPRDLCGGGAAATGSESAISTDRAIHNLRWDFRGKRVLLYFDEAQHLSIECFDTIRELLDEEPYFSLCFAGADDLETFFDRFTGKVERLERRTIDKVYLPSLTAEEATGIIRSELSEFTLDPANIRKQIELATTTVRFEKKQQRYISVGRLMASIREIRKECAAAATEPKQDGVPGDRSSSQGCQEEVTA